MIAQVHAFFWDNEALDAIGWAPEHDHVHTDTFFAAVVELAAAGAMPR